jgi:hypothetical protein
MNDRYVSTLRPKRRITFVHYQDERTEANLVGHSEMSASLRRSGKRVSSDWMERPRTLADRLGRTTHVSVLRMKLLKLWRQAPGNAGCLEEWLVDVANARGARIVSRDNSSRDFEAPNVDALPNEELVVGLLLLQNIDSPQILRLAAQLISRQAVEFSILAHLAVQERVGFILAELAKQALRVDPEHSLWKRLNARFGSESSRPCSVLHYTRLAQPVMKEGRVNAERWVLVS